MKGPTRGWGSKILTLIEFLAGCAFLAGGIYMGIKSADFADDDPPYGEIPMIWIVSGKIIHFKSVSPGYFLSAGMIVAGLMVLIDVAMLYKGYCITLNEESEPLSGKKSGFRNALDKLQIGERRSDRGRVMRIRIRIALTWWTLLLALSMVTGIYDLIQQVSGVLMCVTSLMLLFAAQSAAAVLTMAKKANSSVGTPEDQEKFTRRVENASATIPILTSMSILVVMTPFVAMWVNFYHAKDTTGNPVTNDLMAPMIMFSVGYFLYWFLASAKAIANVEISHVPLFLKPICFLTKMFSGCGKYIVDGGITEEFFIIIVDLANFGVASWIIYRDVIQEWPTDLTP